MPLTRRTLLLAALILPPTRAAAQPATPTDVAAALDDHVAWIVSLFDGGADALTPAEIEARFDANFRALVPPAELIATIRELAGDLGPLDLVEDQSTSPGEFVGVYRSASGDGVMISIAVDPATGLIAGFFITPAALPPVASPAAISEASPIASPVASGPVVTDPEAQIEQYAAILAEIRAVGEPVAEAVLTGDDEALAPYLSSEVASALRSTPISDVIDFWTSRQLQMTFAEAGAHFFGRWIGDAISGAMSQNGVAYTFTLAAEAPQSGELPSGAWSGTLSTIDLGFTITFDTDARGDLTAMLDIPAQRVADVQLADVQYRASQPVGEVITERVFAPGGVNSSYTVDVEWGSAHLRVVIGVDVAAGTVTLLQVVPAMPVLPAPDAPEASGTYRLPFDGTWWVFWGGETELENYHVASLPQRYAYDLVVWKDGATYHGDGTRNEDYWAWSQPALAPADGEVVHVVDGIDDLAPNTIPTERGATRQPAGNHVVIRVADREHVVVAHLRQGSVRVQPGDQVATGDAIGLVGNSGNSSEPHIHMHILNTPLVNDPAAEGIPLRFASILVDGAPARDTVPVQGSFIANP